MRALIYDALRWAYCAGSVLGVIVMAECVARLGNPFTLVAEVFRRL